MADVNQTGTWHVKELLDALHAPDMPSVQRACFTWVDHGVLKETSENTFLLLEVAEAAGSGSSRPAASRLGMTLLPAPETLCSRTFTLLSSRARICCSLCRATRSGADESVLEGACFVYTDASWLIKHSLSRVCSRIWANCLWIAYKLW